MAFRWLSPAALDLAERLLAYDPTQRVSAVQALEAAYFNQEDPPPMQPSGYVFLIFLNLFLYSGFSYKVYHLLRENGTNTKRSENVLKSVESLRVLHLVPYHSNDLHNLYSLKTDPLTRRQTCIRSRID